MSFASIISRTTAAIEQMADHKALKYINYALMVILALSSLMVIRGALNLAFLSTEKTVAEVGSDKAVGTKQDVKQFEQYAPVVDNNIFDINGQKFSRISSQSMKTTNIGRSSRVPTSAKPTVSISLLGTAAWADGSGYAFVLAKGNEQAMYKQGQQIEGAGQLISVYPDKIVLRYSEQEYDVELASLSSKSNNTGSSTKTAGTNRTPRSRAGRTKRGKDFSQFARKTNDNEYVVSKRAIDESLQSPQNILTDARLVPNMISGKQNGFKVMEIKPGGIYETLGLKNRDILLSVNNSELSSMDSAMMAFTTMQGASTITLNVQRSGKNITLKYNIR